MSTDDRTPGQVAYDVWDAGGSPMHHPDTWDEVAAAVLAHHADKQIAVAGLKVEHLVEQMLHDKGYVNAEKLVEQMATYGLLKMDGVS